ncbi:TonB-dependent receptor plug domain-containing protein [Muricauda sp. TY007]|uniref:TonB-dependent receptor n=1 Tax=Allomuricauda sp. TY007 TaxID=2683200 RepID=UPI0013BEF66B|nr:Plug domain-containing protein [Muricauda sp. TY007]NDV16628.1 TonB-dependent receptor plug domain-containing protein [Muricauda sp. TY007]
MKNYGRAYFLLGIVFFSFFTVFAQNSIYNLNSERWKEFSFNFQQNFQDSLALWPERVLLQIANKNVNGDNPIFFKVYLFSGSQPLMYSKSGVLHLELLDDDGVLLKRQFHKIVDGAVEGQLELPRKVAPGNYSVKAYTRWSQNYGADFVAREQIQIGDIETFENKENTTSRISIIPEGGTLLSGHKNRVIVQTPKNQNGDGRIVNKDKQEVAEVSFYSSGLGTAVFEPRKGEEYYLELADGTLSPVPKAKKEGYLLHANNLDKDNARVRVTISNKEQDVVLIGESGGIKYFEKKLSFGKENMLDMVLSKRNFPQGTFNLKLVDHLGTELAKRPIWIAHKKLQIDIEPIDSDDETDLRSYKIKVTDGNNRPVKSQLALSVNQYGLEVKKNFDSDIFEQNDLFAFSNISEESEISSYRKESFLKDLYVLSSKTESDVSFLDKNNISDVKFPFQKGLEIIGHTYDLNNNLLSNTKIQLVATSEKGVWVGEAQTDAQGVIKLKDIQIEGKATLVARTKGEDVKSRLVKIVPFNMVEKKKNVLVPYVMNPQEQKANDPTIAQKPFNSDASGKTIELEEVEVVEKDMERKKLTPSLYGIEVPPNRVNFQDFDKPKSLPQLLAELPGVMVSGVGTLNPSAAILGASGPILWVLDGFPLNQTGGTHLGTASSSPLSEIMAMATDRDIERIELLKGPEASIFGSRGSGGVFIIYTRTGNELEYIPRKDAQLTFEGYSAAMDFNAYKERLSKRKEDKMDLLYWNPNLQTDEDGAAIITIPIPRDVPSIRIEASAISVDGKIGASGKVF